MKPQPTLPALILGLTVLTLQACGSSPVQSSSNSGGGGAGGSPVAGAGGSSANGGTSAATGAGGAVVSSGGSTIGPGGQRAGGSTGGGESDAGSVGGATASGGATGRPDASTTGGAATGGGTSGTGGTTASTGGTAGAGSSSVCGAGDTNLPAEPTIPPACATLSATQQVANNGVPTETTLDTSAIQSALNSCGSGKALKLATNGSNNALVSGPLTLPAGVTLWVDSGVTLYATRSTSVWGSTSGFIGVTGANSGIVGDGTIDGQGGEPNIGSSQSWWDQNAGSGGNSPALIEVRGASNFTLYRITLHNSPKFHVKLGSTGFVAWGVTIQAPSKSTNSAGTALNYSNAHNTDGIDPGEAASNGYIVCSKISTGDDHIAIKGSSSTGVKNLTIAHNRFGAGHGMSIGSEFTGGVSNINVYDLSIDGVGMGTSGGSSNGIRIKSDSSRGGLVDKVTYTDVCVRGLSNPILLTPNYSTATGSSIPQYTNITIRNFHEVSGGSNTPSVTLDGYDTSHMNSITLDNVIFDSPVASAVTASYTNVTLGPGSVSFTPKGTSVNLTNNVSGASTPNPCTGKWTTF
jgi:polygalacturonase